MSMTKLLPPFRAKSGLIEDVLMRISWAQHATPDYTSTTSLRFILLPHLKGWNLIPSDADYNFPKVAFNGFSF